MPVTYIDARGRRVDPHGNVVQEPDSEEKALKDHKVPELKEMAAELDIDGFSDMKKADLVKAIEAAQSDESAMSGESDDNPDNAGSDSEG